MNEQSKGGASAFDTRGWRSYLPREKPSILPRSIPTRPYVRIERKMEEGRRCVCPVNN